MTKNELLKSIGFSEDLIEHYNKTENNYTSKHQNNNYSYGIQHFSVSDTSELHVDTQLKSASNTLIYSSK